MAITYTDGEYVYWRNAAGQLMRRELDEAELAAVREAVDDYYKAHGQPVPRDPRLRAASLDQYDERGQEVAARLLRETFAGEPPGACCGDCGQGPCACSPEVRFDPTLVPEQGTPQPRFYGKARGGSGFPETHQGVAPPPKPKHPDLVTIDECFQNTLEYFSDLRASGEPPLYNAVSLTSKLGLPQWLQALQEMTDAWVDLRDAVRFCHEQGTLAAMAPTLTSQAFAQAHAAFAFIAYWGHTDADPYVTIAETWESTKALFDRKEHDYAAGEPLSNIKSVEENLGVEAWFGVCVRLGDKHSRIQELAQRALQSGEGPSVVDESILDTAKDVINYSFIFCAMLERSLRGEGCFPVLLAA